MVPLFLCLAGAWRDGLSGLGVLTGVSFALPILKLGRNQLWKAVAAIAPYLPLPILGSSLLTSF